MRTDVPITPAWAQSRREFLDKKQAQLSRSERAKIEFYTGAMEWDNGKQKRKK